MRMKKQALIYLNQLGHQLAGEFDTDSTPVDIPDNVVAPTLGMRESYKKNERSVKEVFSAVSSSVKTHSRFRAFCDIAESGFSPTPTVQWCEETGTQSHNQPAETQESSDSQTATSPFDQESRQTTLTEIAAD